MERAWTERRNGAALIRASLRRTRAKPTGPHAPTAQPRRARRGTRLMVHRLQQAVAHDGQEAAVPAAQDVQRRARHAHAEPLRAAVRLVRQSARSRVERVGGLRAALQRATSIDKRVSDRHSARLGATQSWSFGRALSVEWERSAAWDERGQSVAFRRSNKMFNRSSVVQPS